MRESWPQGETLDGFSLLLLSRDPRMLKCHEHFTGILDWIALRHSEVIFQIIIIRLGMRLFFPWTILVQVYVENKVFLKKLLDLHLWMMWILNSTLLAYIGSVLFLYATQLVFHHFQKSSGPLPFLQHSVPNFSAFLTEFLLNSKSFVSYTGTIYPFIHRYFVKLLTIAKGLREDTMI